MTVSIQPYDDTFLPGIIHFWNETFGKRRHALEMTEDLFQERILEVETPVESFEPAYFLVAHEEETVLGLIHVGVHPEDFCFALYGDEWEGGEQGYVAMIGVHPDHRGQGIGSRLWEKGIDRIDHATTVFLDGECLNPFYGNSRGPFAPFFGTAEGISIRPDQHAAIHFFERRGFEPRFRGTSLERDLSGSMSPNPDEAESADEIDVLEESYPALGEVAHARLPYPEADSYLVVRCIHDGLTSGLLSLFPYRHLAENRWGIYEFQVYEEYLDRGLARCLLSEACNELKTEEDADILESFVIKDLSEGIESLYDEFGFRESQEWLIY